MAEILSLVKHGRRGLWGKLDFPTEGWTLIAVHDDGEYAHGCEVCEGHEHAASRIYVLNHSDFRKVQAGPACARLMCGDAAMIDGFEDLELHHGLIELLGRVPTADPEAVEFVRTFDRWKVSNAGNLYLVHRNHRFMIGNREGGGFWASITDLSQTDKPPRYSKQTYDEIDEAKAACVAGWLHLKNGGRKI